MTGLTGPDLRLFPVAALAWALTWWATGQSSRPAFVGAAALLALAVVWVLVDRFIVHRFIGRRGSSPGRPDRSGRWPVVMVTGAMVCTVGAGLLAVTGLKVLGRERDPLTQAAQHELAGRFEGRVMTDPKRIASPTTLRGRGDDGRWVVQVRVSTLTVHHRVFPSSGELVLIAGPQWSGLVAGSHVTGSARLMPAEPADSASAVAFPRSAPTVVDQGSWVWRTAERLRTGLRQACVGLPSDAGGLLPALVVGDTSRLDPRLKTDLQTAGLTHLTAVSGGNLAIIAAVATALIAALGGGRRVRVAGTLLIIAGFVVLARPEPSVLRAAVMGLLAMIGLLLARPGAGLPVLAATAVALLVLDPWLSRSFGFALSVLATAGLMLLVPAWAARARRLPRSVVLAVGVPLAAQVATAPVTILLNPVVSLVTVPANLLADAAVAPATVAGVVAAALSPFWPFGAHLVAWAGGLATGWIALVAHRAAALPANSLPWPGGLSGALLLTVVLVIGLVLGRRRHWTALALGLTAVIGCLTVPHWLSVLPMGAGRPLSAWVVLQCDVGQGSATLIRSGPRRAVLVDTGPEPGPVDRCLREARVDRLDLVLITHFHVDHAGGIAGALHGRGSPPIAVSPLAEPTDQVRAVAAAAAGVGVRPVPVTAPLAGNVGSSVRWFLIPPPASALVAARGAADPEGTEVNNASVVLVAEVQGLRVMALGDVEPESQRPLLRTLQAASLGPVDVVVVAHHGSARQDPELYRFLRPRVALIGVGADNDYGHPAPAALAMLRQIGSVTLRTDRQGWLAVSSGGHGGLSVRTKK